MSKFYAKRGGERAVISTIAVISRAHRRIKNKSPLYIRGGRSRGGISEGGAIKGSPIVLSWL